MCYLLQNPANLLFALQIRWSIFSQRWITESENITCSQVAGAKQLHISSPLPLLLWFPFLWPAPREGTESREGEAECTVSTHRKHKPCTAVAPLCLSTWRRILCLASRTEHGQSFIPKKWCEILPCYNSILIKQYYHSNKICCCPFIPCQSICLQSIL